MENQFLVFYTNRRQVTEIVPYICLHWANKRIGPRRISPLFDK